MVPANLGGVAGGAKYKVNGILFKFSLDVKLHDRWIYGNSKRCDEKAMKSACNELKGKAWSDAWPETKKDSLVLSNVE